MHIALHVFFAIFATIGVVMLVAGIRNVVKAHESEGWQVVPARILSSEVTSYESPSDSGGSTTMYRARVRYEYSYLGERFESDRVAFGTVDTSWRSAQDKFVARYPAGTTVPARVNPDKPAEATLGTGIHLGGFLVGGFGAILFFLAIVAWILFFREALRREHGG